MNMKLLICLSILFSLYSCNSTPDYIQRAESVIELYPDSALQLLDSIIQPDELKEMEMHHYNLLKIQAKDKLYQDITQDTAIFRTAKYFLSRDDYEKATQASYYCGRLLHENKSHKEAIQAYLEASELAESLPNNHAIKGFIHSNIGYLLFNHSDYKEALENFNQAYEYFCKDNNIQNEVSIKIEIGNCYTMLGLNDSAYFYYNESFKLAEESQLTQIKLLALQNLALAHDVQDQTDDAIKRYGEVLILSADSIDRARILMSLAQIYNRTGLQDSARYYLDKAMLISQNINDPYLISGLYNVSSEINEEKGNFRKALDDYKKYASTYETISTEIEKKSILEIQQKYNFERIKNQNNVLHIRNITIFSICIILSLALVISSLVFYNYNQRDKRKLEEAENKALQLADLAASYDESRNSFRDTLLHHFDILKKVAMVQTHLKKYDLKNGEKLLKKINDIVYKQDELDWDRLYSTMNELHYGFLNKLKSLIPTLDESEFRICCLIFSQFTNQEIGIIMKLSSSTITHKRSSIRKKMGLEEYGNIYEYLILLSKNT